MPAVPLLDPASGEERVDIAQQLRIACRRSGSVDPRVPAEVLVVVDVGEDERVDPAVPKADGAGAPGLQQSADRLARVIRAQYGFRCALPRKAFGEDDRGAIDVILGERDDLVRHHGGV
jgi:hypothetical protein